MINNKKSMGLGLVKLKGIVDPAAPNIENTELCVYFWLCVD